MLLHFSNDSNPQTHRVLEKYIVANKLHRAYLERELNRTGVYRSQHQILMFIAVHPNASQKEISRVHHVSTATIAVSLKKLEKGGFISRETDQEDNRYNQIRITEKGMRIVEGSRNVFHEVETSMFDGFTEEELNNFEEILDRIGGNLEKLLQKTGKEENLE